MPPPRTPSKRPGGSTPPGLSQSRKQPRSAAEDHASSKKGQEKERTPTTRGKKLDFEPSALNTLIHYSREGEAPVDPSKRRIFDFITSACEVPRDLEANHKYGPKSGVSYEDRLIAAFCFALFPIPADAEALRPKLKRLVARNRWLDAADLVAPTKQTTPPEACKSTA